MDRVRNHRCPTALNRAPRASSSRFRSPNRNRPRARTRPRLFLRCHRPAAIPGQQRSAVGNCVDSIELKRTSSPRRKGNRVRARGRVRLRFRNDCEGGEALSWSKIDLSVSVDGSNSGITPALRVTSHRVESRPLEPPPVAFVPQS
jgi:hypothetical protein